jgi:hypothetical protein
MLRALPQTMQQASRRGNREVERELIRPLNDSSRSTRVKLLAAAFRVG